MTVVDVGANIGYFTRMMAEAVGPTGRVLAVEPEPTNFATLIKNLNLGNCQNVTPVRCAAGDSSRWQSLTVIESLHGGHFLSNSDGESTGRVEVQVLPLDELLNPDAPIDFIKIDIEGFDHLAIAGLRRTLRVHKPLVLVEFYPGAIRRAGFQPADVLRGYRDLGLQIAHELAPDEHLDVDDDTFVSLVDRGEMYGGSQAHTNLILRASDVGNESVVPSAVTWMTEVEWRPLLQRAIDAFAEGRLEEGRATCLALLSDGALPWDVREAVYLNQTSYAQSLADLVPGLTNRMLTWPVAKGAIRREPSPVVLGDRLLAVARMTLPSPDAPRRDVLLTLDEGLRVTESVLLRDETGLADRFDDVRPFMLDDRLFAAVVLYDAEAEEWTQAGIVAIEEGVYRDLHRLGPRAGYFHGGWAPVSTPSGVRVIAWWEPTEVLRFDPLGGTFAREALRFAPRIAERFWAGSQGVAIPGGYLTLVNEEAAATEDDAQIFSRFVRLDETWQVTAVSPQFYVSQPGEDVASGLARRGDRLIAGFTVGGRAALLARLDLTAVLATLTPVPAPGRTTSGGT
jgi:FkbM family methyltransferase